MQGTYLQSPLMIKTHLNSFFFFKDTATDIGMDEEQYGILNIYNNCLIGRDLNAILIKV